MKKNLRLCTLCGNAELEEFADFGRLALAGAFLKDSAKFNEKKYRLRLGFCNHCYGVQVIDHIDPNVLFRNYFYSSSNIKTLSDHFAELADEITLKFINDKSKDVVIEFGCNDGVLLKPLSENGITNIIGIDPADNIVKKINIENIDIINDYFNVDVSLKIRKKYGKAKVILANNVFAHISEIRNTAESVSSLLEDDGVFIFEVHYLGKILDEMQYDFIYHEHLYYHSLTSLVNFLKINNLEVFDVKFINIHAGSIRVYTSKRNSIYSKKISPSVESILRNEREKKFNNIKTFNNLNKNIKMHTNELVSLIKDLKSKNKTILGYGASGRANTVLQLSKINSQLLPYIIDDAPEKHGYLTPGSHIPIISREILNTPESPDYLLLFAWSFADEIIYKNAKFLEEGGKFIVPLPKINIVGTEQTVKKI